MNAYVEVWNGNVEHALKILKKQLVTGGVVSLFKHNSRLHVYQSPTVRRKNKASRARARLRKTARRAEQRDRHREEVIG